MEIGKDQFEIIPLKEKIVLPENPTESIASMYGGWRAESDALTMGKIRFESDNERILIGDATEPLTGTGIFQGLDTARAYYDWRVGNPSGQYIHWDGSTSILTIVGSISASAIDIPNTSTANSFHTDSSGNSWWGSTVIGSATAKILNTGAATFTSATVTGAITTTAGSVINGTYIDSLIVSKLATGTISSKQITLDVTAGTGDSYIAAGKTDFTNVQSGFILGIDDSDSDLAKFYVGDANHYFNFNGTTADATGTRAIENFVIGETVTAGQLVCLPSKTIALAQADFVTDVAWTDPANPDTAQGGSGSSFYVGYNASGMMRSYIKFDFAGAPPSLPNWNNVDKVTLSLAVVSDSANTGRIILFYLVAGDWSESTITHNNQPGQTGSPLYKYTLPATVPNPLEIDITELYKAMEQQSGNYGLIIKTGESWAATENIRFSGNGISITYIKNDVLETNPVYLANYADYNKVKNILGIALDSGNAGDTIRVQTSGVYAGDFTAGEDYYLQANAAIGANATAVLTGYWQPKIGRAKSSTELIIDIEMNRNFIRSITYDLGLTKSGTSSTTPSFYVPRQAKECIITFDCDGYDNPSSTYYNDQIILKKDRVNSVTKIMKNYSAGTTVSSTAVWSTNTIYVTVDTAITFSAGTVTFYFYE